MDFIFFIWQLSFATLPRREQNLTFSLCYCTSRERRVEAGAASSHSCISDSKFFLLHGSPSLRSIHHSTFILIPLLFSNWVFLSPVSFSLVPPSRHPHSHGVITVLHCLVSSAVKQSRSNETGGEKCPAFCLITDWLLFVDPSHVSSATFRIMAKAASS